MIFLNIVLIFILIGLNAFFVAVQFAAVSSRRSRLDLLADSGSRASELVHAWLEHPWVRDRLIAACQFGITVISLTLGVVGEKVFRAILQPVFAGEHLPDWLQAIDLILPALPIILMLIFITGFYVVLGEQVPKLAVLHNPEKFALFAAPIMDIFNKVFGWIIDTLNWFTRQVLQASDIPARSGAALITPEDLKQMVSGPQVEKVLEAPEREMLSAVIDFGELVVKQIMISRLEIIALDTNAPLYAAIDLLLENSITKIPIYEDDLDHITGILHLRDVVKAQKEKNDLSTPVGNLKREALFVPETISVNDLLHEFRARQSHIAIVMDEFGGTSGLVTLEDLLEEIVGDVRDSFETAPPSIVTT
ncbi:MAG: hemolysin family protein, partial [Anaerolineaceae bacterium]